MKKYLWLIALCAMVGAASADLIYNPGEGGGATELDGLSDVADLSGAASGEVLEYNGTKWTNATASYGLEWAVVSGVSQPDNEDGVNVLLDITKTVSSNTTTEVIISGDEVYAWAAGSYRIDLHVLIDDGKDGALAQYWITMDGTTTGEVVALGILDAPIYSGNGQFTMPQISYLASNCTTGTTFSAIVRHEQTAAGAARYDILSGSQYVTHMKITRIGN